MKIINGSKSLTFSAKSSILDILLGPENASGFTVFNYFHQKNGNKYVVSENSCSEFRRFPRKISTWNCFLKQSCKLPDTYSKCSSEKFMKFSEQFSQKHPCEWRLLQLVVTEKCLDQNIFFKKYLIRFFSFMFWYSVACVPRDKCITDVQELNIWIRHIIIQNISGYI